MSITPRYTRVAGLNYGTRTSAFLRLPPEVIAWKPILLLLIVCLVCASRGTAEELVNLAQGKPYTLSAKPNYGLCTDDGDKIQLTDGQYVEGYFWTQQGTVGWNGHANVTITLDLAKVEAIRGVSFSTAAGVAGVKWPHAIHILVSDDGQKFYYVGDLVASHEGGAPAPDGYRVFRYRTTHLQTRGRYLRLVVVAETASRFIFCDEIAVFRGEESLRIAPHSGQSFSDSPSFLTALGCQRRLRADLQNVTAELRSSGIPAEKMAQVQREIARLSRGIETLDYSVDAATFKAIVPFNELHRGIFRLHAAVLSAKNLPAMMLWHTHRYAPMSLFDAPTPGFSGLEVLMMNNEHRGEVFNLTNTSADDQTVRLQTRGLPGGLNPPYLRPYRVEWVDTYEGVVTASALVDLDSRGDWFEVRIPAGMTRQVWLSFHFLGIPPGSYRGTVLLRGSAFQGEFPLTLSVTQSTFPEVPDFDFYMWDYTQGKGAYSITPRTRVQAIADLKSHHVTVPVAGSGVQPSVDASYFDVEGNLVKTPGFAVFDAWVREWPSARRYYVFANVGNSFAGFPAGKPQFQRAVGQWAKAWADHNRQLGMKSGQVVFYPVDEPDGAAQYQRFRDWAQPVRTRSPEIACFLNPPGGNSPWEFGPGLEAIQAADILCPVLGKYLREGQRARVFYRRLRERGKALHFYAMSRAGIHDPTACQRLMPWISFVNGATGFGFWSYCDEGRAENCWNEYTRTSTDYCPVYLEKGRITASKYWEAAREGVEDYQCLKMLSDAAEGLLARDARDSRGLETRTFLQSLETDVIWKYVSQQEYLEDAPLWNRSRDLSLIDNARGKSLKLMSAWKVR